MKGLVIARTPGGLIGRGPAGGVITNPNRLSGVVNGSWPVNRSLTLSTENSNHSKIFAVHRE
jgi:hypothetical protein